MSEVEPPVRPPPSDSESEGSDYQPKKKETIPDAVDHFLGQLLSNLQKKNVSEIHTLYEDTYNKLTDKHYKNQKWPSAEAVEEQVSSDPLFLILYKELYYRHIFAKFQPTFENRKSSWENYSKLLELFIEDFERNDNERTIELPVQWLWDILDEFIYHYQTYCTFRNKAAKMQRDNDINAVRNNPEVFETTRVLTYLHRLVESSSVRDYLKSTRGEFDIPDPATGPWSSEFVLFVGYFGIIQLMRTHSLLGDYYLAMKCIEDIDFQAEVPLYYKISASHITLYYYMGFAYLMLRRYVDAIKTFSGILIKVSKTSGMHTLSIQSGFLMKKHEQIYALLLICQSLCPEPLDDHLEKTIRDKHQEKQDRLFRGEELCFEELFAYACPKFVTAALPESLEKFNQNEAHQRQCNLFLQDVKQQKFLPTIRSYMKLYTSIKISKLAQLCEMDEEGLRDQLLCVVHKMRQLVRQPGKPPLSGEIQMCSDIEFIIDGDTVHISSQKGAQPVGDMFLEHIGKFQDILRKLEA